MSINALKRSAADAAELAHPPVLSREDILAKLPAVAAEIARDAVHRELTRTLPFDIFQMLRTTGLTWLRVPKSLGGPGGTMADMVEVTCALAAADSNVAHALRSHFGFVEGIAIAPDTDHARTFAPYLLAGKIFGGAHMEINTPRPNMLRTRLTRNGDHYVLSGQKFYATGAIFADYQSFTAMDDQDKIIAVLIPTSREGVAIHDDWDGMGQSMTASGGVDLDNVMVFPHEVCPRDGGDPFRRRHNATRAQLHLMAVVCGIARNVLSDAIHYTTTKARSAKHSASATASGDHFVQQIVGDIAATSHVIDAAIADTARALDMSAEAILSGAENVDEVVLAAQLANSKTQIVVGRLAVQAAERLFDTGGGSATARKLALDRHWRNVRTILNHNPALLRGRVLGDYYLNGERADFDEGRVF